MLVKESVVPQSQDPNFWANRTARHIVSGGLSEAEEGALRADPEFRKAVEAAFRRLYGEGAELEIKIDDTGLTVDWFRRGTGERPSKH